MFIGLIIFTFGAILFLINKGLKCASYAFGYLSIIIQGIGIGIILCEIYP